MPTYDYRCSQCDRVFEVTRPMSASREASCTSCGAPAKRVFSPVGVAFKGTGFHNTDYKPRASDEAPSCPAKSDSGSCAGCPAAD